MPEARVERGLRALSGQVNLSSDPSGFTVRFVGLGHAPLPRNQAGCACRKAEGGKEKGHAPQRMAF
jgi:hypothetical protein